MQLTLLKSLWGMTGSLEEKLKKIATAGIYKGVECGLPRQEEASLFKQLLEKYRLQYVAMIFTQGDDYAGSFHSQMEAAAEFHSVEHIRPIEPSCTVHSFRIKKYPTLAERWGCSRNKLPYSFGSWLA